MSFTKRFLTWEGALSFLEDIGLIKSQTQTLHDEVDADATAVETSRQQIEDIQTDVTNRQTTIETLHDEVDADATAVETSRQQIEDIQTDVTNRQATIQTLHDEVDADATAVETSRQQIEDIQTDVTNRQATIQTLHDEVDADATAVETSRQQIEDIQTDVTNRQATIQILHDEVDADATAVETSRQQIEDIQTDVTNRQTTIQTLHDEVDADATAVSTMLGMVQALFDTIQGWYNAISGWYTQMEAWVSQVSTNTTAAANSASQAGASAASAANLVLGVSTNRPSIRPSLLLDFANSELLDPRVTYTRNDSAKTYFDRAGVLRTARPNEWPREYDPVTGKCLGRSVWESRTNRVQRSGELDNTWWGKAQSTVSPGYLAPDGSMSATKLIPNTTITEHAVFNSTLTRAAGATITLSVFVKKDWGRPRLYLGNNVFGNQLQASFNLNTLAVPAVSVTGGSWINTSARITDVGGGWYRISITGTANTSDTTLVAAIYLNDETGNGSYAGDDINGLPLWGVQVEEGAFATPYIPTTNAAVTRQADVAQITGANFAEVWNSAESTLYVEGNGTGGSSTGHVIASVQQDSSNYAYFGLRTNVQNTRALTMQTTAGGFAILNGIIPYGDMRIAGVIKKGAYRSIVNGGSIQSSTYNYAITPLSLQIGRLITSYYHNGTISCICIWPKALPDVEIQAMVTSGLLSGKSANQLPTAGDLGSAAFENLASLLMRPNRQEFQVEGTGAGRTITIRRPYDFQFALVDATGSTVTAQPSATCVANTNYSLTFNAPAGTLLTYAITPIFYS